MLDLGNATWNVANAGGQHDCIFLRKSLDDTRVVVNWARKSQRESAQHEAVQDCCMFSEGGWHGLDCCHGIEAFSQSSSQPMQSPRKVCWHRSPSAAFRNGKIASPTRRQHCGMSRPMFVGRPVSQRKSAVVGMHRRHLSVGMEVTALVSAAPMPTAGSGSFRMTSVAEPTTDLGVIRPAGLAPSLISCAAWPTRRLTVGQMCLHHKLKRSSFTRWTTSTLTRNMEMSGAIIRRGMYF